ncbi:MAG: hypothetical protein DRJ40_05755 [Thermoprotei archaeon]|nr:MAG: hypothetical protein DRJ40_05755 [Thermoprotei archaeon]
MPRYAIVLPIKDIKPVTVSFVAEVPFMVSCSIEVPREVIEKLIKEEVPEGYPVHAYALPLEYVKDLEAKGENTLFYGVPLAAWYEFSKDLKLHIDEFTWEMIYHGCKEYLKDLRKGDPIQLRIVLHTGLFISYTDEEDEKKR